MSTVTIPESKPRDKDELVINPITSQLDTVRNFNPDRIVTDANNSAGYPMVTYDPVSGQYLQMGPMVVTDDDGTVVFV